MSISENTLYNFWRECIYLFFSDKESTQDMFLDFWYLW